MNKRLFPFAILVMALAFAMMVIGCDDGSKDGNGPPPPVHQHDSGIWRVMQAASCENNGVQKLHCTSCNEVLETDTIPALGHDWEDKGVITPATCEADGKSKRICKRCDIEDANVVLPALGHDYEWTVTTPIIYPTADVETGVCSHDPSHTETHSFFTRIANMQTYLAALPTNTTDDPYAIALNVDDITSLKTTLDNEPDKYVSLDLSGSTITRIGGYLSPAFYDGTGCATLTGIIIPDSVTVIGDGAFSRCTSLESVTIPNSVTIIGASAFSLCTSLESVTIPYSVTSIGNYAFSGCDNLISVTIPYSVTIIGASAFSGSNLTAINVNAANTAYSSVDGVLYNKNKTILITYPEGKTADSFAIPSSVTSIGENAFFGCENLKSVTIPNSVTSIGNGAFCWCTSLKSVNIPNGVTSIGKDTFSSCRNLESVTISNSVTSIGYEAFYDCRNLESVILPKSVTSIGEMAFYRCWNLTRVTFKGTIPSSGFHSGYDTGYERITVFLYDLREKFYETDPYNGRPGTYIRTEEDYVRSWSWTPYVPTVSSVAGSYRYGTEVFTFSDTGTFTHVVNGIGSSGSWILSGNIITAGLVNPTIFTVVDEDTLTTIHGGMYTLVWTRVE